MEDTNMNELIPVETAAEEIAQSEAAQGRNGLLTALIVTAVPAGTILVWEKLVKPGVRKVKSALTKRKVAKAKKAEAEEEKDDVSIDDIPEI